VGRGIPALEALLDNGEPGTKEGGAGDPYVARVLDARLDLVLELGFPFGRQVTNSSIAGAWNGEEGKLWPTTEVVADGRAGSGAMRKCAQ
jgi:hypothetical protein